MRRGLGFLLLGANLSALVATQVAAELALVAAAVVEVDGVRCAEDMLLVFCNLNDADIGQCYY